MSRFISIILISFLGAAVFAGLAATSPNMKRAGDQYYDRHNVMDIRMLSTYGFSQEDVDAIRHTAGISGVMASYSVDAAGSVGDKDYTFRINGLSAALDSSDPGYINQLKITQGRMPRSRDEAVVIRSSIGMQNIRPGSVLHLDPASNEAIADTLVRLEYTIVGVADSPHNMFYMQGSTPVGGGSISYFLYIPQENFHVDSYTDLYATVKGAKERNTFEKEYFTHINLTAQRLKALAEERQGLLHDRFQRNLDRAGEEYANTEKEAEERLTEAKSRLEDKDRELENAKQKVLDGWSEYREQEAEARRELASAEQELGKGADRIAEAEKQIAAGQAKYDAADSALAEARKKLDEGQAVLDQKTEELEVGKAELAKSKAKLDTAQKTYDAKAAQVQAVTGKTVEEIEAESAAMKAGLEKLTAEYDAEYQPWAPLIKLKKARDDENPGTPEYDSKSKAYQAALQKAGISGEEAEAQITLLDVRKNQLEQAKKKYQALIQYAGDLGFFRLIDAREELSQKWTDYSAAAARITEGEEQLASAGQQQKKGESEYLKKERELKEAGVRLSEAGSQLDSAKAAYRENAGKYKFQKEKAEKKLARGKAELNAAAAKIKQGEQELAKKQNEYEGKEAEVRGELADAKRSNAENKLGHLGAPKWYVLDRHKNESFVAYEEDIVRMRDLATVFPIVFYLVASLVCLTTMTRMVEEDRTLIGTFKALGYSNGKIAGKYLKYAASASLIGGVAGIFFGFWLLPTIIWMAYGIAFVLPKMKPAFYPGTGALSVFTTVIVTTLSTGIAVRNSLKESPAGLMRPKAPQSGKRVFLEYVKPIWTRLTFTQKVTVRNLGLNKKRLVITLIGIIGCTALVVTAFGAKNAEMKIVDDQFNGIFCYNTTVGFQGKEPSSGLLSRLSDPAYFQKVTRISRGAGEASREDSRVEDDSYNISIISPKEPEEFTDFIRLFNPKTMESLPFSEDSAVITKKLSMNLKVGVGDTLWVNYLGEAKKFPVKITGITENYTFHYVYLGRNAYEAAFGKPPEYDEFLAIRAGNRTEDEISSYLSKASDIGAITFMDDLMGNIRTSIRSIDRIIWILIIAAGLLAFVVLYNLTNINIGERQREIATLKVLGFYDKETYSYIFRETLILSMIGSALGLFCGIFLYHAVIATVEPDMLLLTRDITWQGFLGTAGLMMFFTWTVNQCMKPRIRNIDMLGSLQSVE